jgi:hypothetical protein
MAPPKKLTAMVLLFADQLAPLARLGTDIMDVTDVQMSALIIAKMKLLIVSNQHRLLLPQHHLDQVFS